MPNDIKFEQQTVSRLRMRVKVALSVPNADSFSILYSFPVVSCELILRIFMFYIANNNIFTQNTTTERQKRVKKLITVEIKKEIICKHESGTSVRKLSAYSGMEMKMQMEN